MESIIESFHGERKTLLLHACCAPCSSYVLEYLSRYFDITLLFYNPNIHPAAEYEKRLAEAKRLCAEVFPRVKVLTVGYDPQEYYEAAVLDGASKLQQARYVTLPHLKHIIVIMLILSMGGMFKGDIGLSYNVTMNSGALYEVVDVIDSYVYRALKTLGNTGMSTAAGLYQSVVGFVLIMISNKIVRHVDEESALF